MEKKIFTIAIIGLGGRGGDVYGSLINEEKDKFKITALCDLKQDRLDMFAPRFDVPTSACFDTEEAFFKEKRADVLIVATQDQDHVRHCLKGFALGYNIMTEKPITDKREECSALLEAQKKAGTKALVCHVLRYAPAFLKAAEILKSGSIGKLIAINALERVGAAHQAHSYVRGNWRRRDETTPMILAKCCHDLDLLQFYANSACQSVSSIGDLAYFKEENAPDGSAARCLDCKLVETCPYSAKKLYCNRWHEIGSPEDLWPYNILANAPLTEEKLMKALQEGPYGRCVYRCDNDVVDHQITSMTFENGVKAVLTMTAFTGCGGRRYHFHGTLGEMILDESENRIRLHIYGEESEIIPLDELLEKGYGHGGGDYFLIQNLYKMLCGAPGVSTFLNASVESHLMGICAEESRLQNGKLIYVHE